MSLSVPNILNLPIHFTSQQFHSIFESQVVPRIIAHAPDIIFLSAGFDARPKDPVLEGSKEDILEDRSVLVTVGIRFCSLIVHMCVSSEKRQLLGPIIITRRHLPNHHPPLSRQPQMVVILHYRLIQHLKSRISNLSFHKMRWGRIHPLLQVRKPRGNCRVTVSVVTRTLLPPKDSSKPHKLRLNVIQFVLRMLEPSQDRVPRNSRIHLLALH